MQVGSGVFCCPAGTSEIQCVCQLSGVCMLDPACIVCPAAASWILYASVVLLVQVGYCMYQLSCWCKLDPLYELSDWGKLDPLCMSCLTGAS